ncbi:hypothetical protein L9F63_001187, partial [Diploptera punctata]
MQCGFACLEAGSVRSKNTTNIIMKNIMDIFISSVAYWLVGYALAHGNGSSVVGLTYWAGIGLPADKRAHWFFHCIFAATAATIISGAVCERCNYVAYIAYSAIISGVVYPLATHWVWDDEGWLTNLGYEDYSGDGPVHLLAGVCSFFGALFIGPRIGKFGFKKNHQYGKEELVGHSVPLVGIGGLILIAGFLAFNAAALGQMTKADSEDTIAQVIINTILGGSGASISMLAISKLGLIGQPTWSFAHTLNSGLSGMVSVCAAANLFPMWGSMLSGIFMAPIYLALHNLMLIWRIDDPLDTVAVHFGGGLWGLISASFFAEGGIVYGANYISGMRLVYRMIGAVAIIAWASVGSCILFGTLSICGKLRVSEEEEIKGLDIAMHNEPGYPIEGWTQLPILSSNDFEDEDLLTKQTTWKIEKL